VQIKTASRFLNGIYFDCNSVFADVGNGVQIERDAIRFADETGIRWSANLVPETAATIDWRGLRRRGWSSHLGS
jgi:hypothetical protein